MSHALKLFHNDMSVCAQKVRLVLDQKKLTWENEHLNLRAGDQFKPDFLKINPKALIPVLVHNEQVITESNIIVEYIEETFPENPLMPSTPLGKVDVRKWLLRLDTGLHEQVASISFCIAFKHQLLERYPTQEKLDQFISNIPDPYRRSVMTEFFSQGLSSERLKFALIAYDKLLVEMEKALAHGEWLVGSELSLADFGFIPYIDRLDQLQLSQWWENKPGVQAWIERMRSLPAYQTAIGDYLNPSYLALMKEHGESAWKNLSNLMKSYV